MTHRNLLGPVAAATLLAVALGLAATVAADDKREALKERTYRNEDWGIQVVKPEDKSWMFPGEEVIDKMFKDARQVAFVLLKMKSETSKPGEDNPLAFVFCVAYPADDRYKIEGQEVSPGSMKQFAKLIFKSVKDDYKDIKDEKELGEVQGYAFAPKILKFSFKGIHKKYGQPALVQNFFFKDNQLVYEMVVDIPQGDDKIFAKDIDTIMRGITLFKKEKKR